MNATEARRAVNEAALARDRTALVAVAASLPVTQAFAYERRRARAYAHALDGKPDFALAELSLAAAAEPPSAATLAADSAQLHLLLGDPARAVLSLEGAARVEHALDPHAGAVLVAAIREAPAAWFRGTLAAFRSGSVRTTAATLGAAFDTVADRTVFRAGIAGAALVAAVVSFFTLPNHFFEDTSAAPRAGVTAPHAALPPEVVVAKVPETDTPAAPGVDRATPDRTNPSAAVVGGSATTLVGFDVTGSTSSAAPEQQPSPGRPRASRPAPRPVAPPTPAPPAQAPNPTPAAPAPGAAAQPAVELPVAAAAPAAPAPAAQPPAPTEPKKAKAKGKEHAPGQQKKREAPPAPPAAPPAPAPAVAAPAPAPAAAESEPEEQEHAEKEHGRDKDKEKGKKGDD